MKKNGGSCIKFVVLMLLFVILVVASCGKTEDWGYDNVKQDEIGLTGASFGGNIENSSTEEYSTEVESHLGDKVVSDNTEQKENDDSIADETKIENDQEKRWLWETISAGVRSCVFLLEDNTVKFYGDGYSGQDESNSWQDIVSVSNLGYLVAGITKNKDVVIAGKAYDPINTDDWHNIIDIAVGEQYVVALDESGMVYATGHNADGQCDFAGREDVRLIATGWRHTVIVDNDNNIEVCGYGSNRQNDQIAKLKQEGKLNSNIVKVVGGGGYEKKSGHTVILKEDGTVSAVGNNTYGQCNVSDWSGIVDIAAGDWHTVGLRYDGTVLVTGDYGVLNPKEEPLAKWSDIVAVSAGRGYTIGLKSDGSVVFAGYDHDNGSQWASTQEGVMIYHEWYFFNNSVNDR